MSFDRITRHFYPGVLCAVIILILTGLPGSCFPRVNPQFNLDKVAHVLMYLGFAVSCLWGYREEFCERGKRYQKNIIHIVIFISIVYGALTEVMQEFIVPMRCGSVYDWIADVVGTFIGVVGFYFFYGKRNKKEENVVL